MSARNSRPSSASPATGRGPQQRLRLPDQRPALVVGAVGLQRAHQRAVLALGAQVGVEAELRVRARRRRAAGAAPGPRASRPAAPPPRRLPAIGLVHEQHVGVAAVAHLGAAEPAHADHEQPGAERRRGRPRPAARRCRAPTCSVAAVRSVRAHPTPRRGPAPRSGRRRRRGTAPGGGPPAPPSSASSADSLRRVAAVIVRLQGLPRPRAAARPRRRGSPPTPARGSAGRRRSGCGASTCASRSAALPSSRSILRYQCVVPSASLMRAEGEQPGVGVGLVGEPAEHHRQQRAAGSRRAG